jgi:cytoskeletal protein CcmA (bactofilin family)
MFKLKNSNEMSKIGEALSSGKVNTIVEGTHIEGLIQSEGNFRIDGSLKGDVNIKGRLIIGPSGVIEGKVHCQNAEIEGHFKGNIQVSELLYLKATAKIYGDSSFNKLRVEEGALLECTCNYNAASKAQGAVIKDLKHGEKAQQPAERAEKEERTA